MFKKGIAPTVLVVLVVLSGCSGVVNTTPTDEQPSPTKTLSLGAVTYPDGVTESSVDGDVVASNHKEYLSDKNLTLREEINVSTGGSMKKATLHEKVGANQNPVWFQTEKPNKTETAYVQNWTKYVRNSTGNNTTYRVESHVPSSMILPPSYSGSRDLNRTFKMAEFEPVGAYSKGGQKRIVLETTSDNHYAKDGSEITEFNATIEIDQRGFVHSLSTRIVFSRNNQTVEQQSVMTITDINSTTVPTPSWLEEAKTQRETTIETS